MNREALVDRHDFSVMQNEIGRGGLADQGAERESANRDKKLSHRPLTSIGNCREATRNVAPAHLTRDGFSRPCRAEMVVMSTKSVCTLNSEATKDVRRRVITSRP